MKMNCVRVTSAQKSDLKWKSGDCSNRRRLDNKAANDIVLEPEDEIVKLDFLQEAIRLSIEKMEADEGGPFGAVVVRNEEIVGKVGIK